MQNEDEELRGLEEKLSRLTPKGLDESYMSQLVSSLKSKGLEGQELHQGGDVYPPNVLWMRFAPIAAAAGVVLLGSFFIHYESRMGGLQAQGGATSAKLSTEQAVLPATVKSETDAVSDTQWATLPVPRLGVGETYSPLNSFDPSLLPVSGQSYLQPSDASLEFYKPVVPADEALHFSDAYQWQEAVKPKEVK